MGCPGERHGHLGSRRRLTHEEALTFALGTLRRLDAVKAEAHVSGAWEAHIRALLRRAVESPSADARQACIVKALRLLAPAVPDGPPSRELREAGLDEKDPRLGHLFGS